MGHGYQIVTGVSLTLPTLRVLGMCNGALFFFVFFFVFQPGLVASVAFVGVWRLWIYHALSVYLSIYVSMYLCI